MKLNQKIISRFLIGSLILFMSCMDPIEEPPDQYSEYSEIILYNPDDGVPNGSFENGLEEWSELRKMVWVNDLENGQFS